MSNWFAITGIACALLAVHGRAAADEIDSLQSSIRNAGDVDGDGTCDLMIADRVPIPGVVWVVSGKTRERLFALRPRIAAQGLPASMDRMGDLNGDGKSDLAVCWRKTPEWDPTAETPDRSGHVRVCCGADGGELFVFRDTWTVASAGDINADGVPDVFLGASPLGRAQVRSGCDGSLILEQFGQPGSFGHSLAALGDVNGDGRGDIAVGSPDPCDPLGGKIEVFSGADGRTLACTTGKEFAVACGSPDIGLGISFGWTMVPAPDLDGDGAHDLLLSVIHRFVAVCSGKDLHPIHSVDARHRYSASDAFGSSVDIVGDINSDGSSDWIVGANETSPRLFDRGYAETHSGRDGELLRLEFECSRLVDPKCGADVCGVGDVNGDRVPDLAIALPAKSWVELLSGSDGALIEAIDVAKLREQR